MVDEGPVDPVDKAWPEYVRAATGLSFHFQNYPVRSQQRLAIAEQRLGRKLTNAEKEEFGVPPKRITP